MIMTVSNTPNPADYARRLLASQPRLRAYVRSMVFNPGDVDDLLQDVATIGWEKFGTFEPERPFDAWLLGIARNRVLQYFQAQKKDPTPSAMKPFSSSRASPTAHPEKPTTCKTPSKPASASSHAMTTTS